MTRTLFLLTLAGCSAADELKVPASLTLGATEMATLTGSVTWTVTVDADAEAGGFFSCSYVRDYAGTEDRSRPWLCPDCDVHVVADVAMPDADLACYDQVSSSPPLATEWIGVDDGAWWRSLTENRPLQVQADVTAGSAGAWDVAGSSGPHPLATGTYTLSWQGGFEQGVTLGDPYRGLLPPPRSSCGWPRVDTPAYAGEQRLEVGAQVPDGLFMDLCDEGVSLHDFAGQYVVLDISAADCIPCQVQASSERAWLQMMRAEGHHVEVVTLLAPSLGAPYDESPAELLVDWTFIWDLRSPVLADRGYGYTLSGTLYEDVMAYPTSFVLAPNLTLLGAVQGFEGWGPVQELIIEHRRDR